MAKKTTAKKAATKKSTTKKATTKKPSTEKARKAAIKQIDQRLAGGKQDHEVPSPKEVANNARLAAHAAKSAPKAARTRKPAKDAARANVGAKVVRDKRPSGLDLAAKALTQSKEPLGAKALAEKAIAAGWQTKGKTPEATLYSAITREIKAKGDDSRFIKSGKGLFAARSK